MALRGSLFGAGVVFLAVAALLASLSAAAGEVRVRGMSPAQQQALLAQASEKSTGGGDGIKIGAAGTSFRCSDGTVVPWRKVNDDYCDCPRAALLSSDSPSGGGSAGDGSSAPVTDESGTGACGGNTRFFCENRGAQSVYLAASAVNDGICDCCDGSDEWQGKKQCENFCADAGREFREERVNELQAQKDGLAAAERVRQESATERVRLETEAAEWKREREPIEAQRDEAQAARDAAKKEEDDTRDRLRAEGKLRPEETTEEQREEDKENPDEHDFDDDEVAHDEDGVLAEGAENPEDAAAEVAEPAPPQEEEAEQAPEIPDEVHAASQTIVEELEATTHAKQGIVDELQRKIDDLNGKISGADDALKGQYGQDNELFSQRSTCLEADSPEYTYELCMFNKVEQKPKNGGGGTSLGTWHEEENLDGAALNAQKWKFTEGLKCWGGPSRSTHVTLECGADFAVSDPNEPNRCEYSLRLQTPMACTAERVSELEAFLAADSGSSSSTVEPIDYI